MALKEAYFAVEDKYYELCDWLEERSVPIYRFFVDPIENTGMPSFPFFLLILALIIGGIGFLALSMTQPSTTSVNVAVFSGETPLDGVPVTLLVEGEAARTAVSVNGNALFENVPVGKKGVVRIEQEGYESFVQSISIEAGTGQTVSAALQTAAPVVAAKQRIELKVVDSSGAGIPGATIYFEDQEVTAGADGKAFIEASPDQSYSVMIEKEGYETKNYVVQGSEKQKTVRLVPKKDAPVTTGGSQEETGDVSVYVKNEQGEPVEATVTLYNAELGSPVLTDKTNEHGSVFWAAAAAVGAVVYASAEPVDAEAYAPYDGLNDAQEVSAAGETEFRITLKKKVPAEFGKISITVIDDAGNAVEGAEVKMFLSGSSRQAAGDSAQTTDADGKASFEVATGQSVYITAYAEGYLPGLLKELEAGDDKQFKLSKAILGNNGDAQVGVVDADGNPVAGAIVEMVYADGFNTGIPLTTTDSTGAASFTALPIDELLVANAVYGSLKGLSDSFSAVLGEPVSVTVTLEPTFGNIVVLAKDATNNAAIPAISAVATFADGEEIANCTATVSGTCQLKVRANKEITVSVTSTGYAPQDTEKIVVSTGEALTKTVALLPASLVNNLTITDFHLENYDGTPVQGNQIAKGGFYWVKFTANLPTSDQSGLFVSVGDKATVDEDIASITLVQQPSNLTTPPSSYLNPQITFSSSYNPGPNCGNDLAIQKDALKWVNFNYRNFSGRPTMSFLIFVKPTATNKDRLVFRYRAYAGKGKIWVRTPKDEELGDKEKTAAKDACYAESLAKEYNIVDGTGSCDSNACMSLAFARAIEPETRSGSGFTAAVNEDILAYFEIRPFVTLTSPYIKLVSPQKEVLFTQTQIGDNPAAEVPAGLEFADKDGQKIYLQSFTTGKIAVTLAAGQTLAGTVSGTTVFQNSFSKIRLEFGDARGIIKVLEAPIVIQGTGQLNLTVDPQAVYIGQNQKITATVATVAAGQQIPITDAKVWLHEGDGNPFNGNTYQNSPLTGDGTKGNGEDGQYVFTKVSPVYNGTLVVEAERTGFAASMAPIAVWAEQFLQFEPDETTGLQYAAETCNKSQVFKITNPLDIPIPINISIESTRGTDCLKLTGAAGLLCARGYCTMTLPKKKTVTLSAKLLDRFAQACDLAISTTLLANGGISSNHVLPVTIDCRPTTGTGIPCGTWSDCPSSADCLCLDPNQGAKYPNAVGQKAFGIGKEYPAGGRGEVSSNQTNLVNGVEIPISAETGADCGPGGCECLTPEGEKAGYCDCITGFENFYTIRFGELWTHYEWSSRFGDLWRTFTGDNSKTIADRETGVVMEGPQLQMTGKGASADNAVELTVSPLLPYDAFSLSVIVPSGVKGFQVLANNLPPKPSCFLLKDVEWKLSATHLTTLGFLDDKKWVTNVGNSSSETYVVIFNPECLATKYDQQTKTFNITSILSSPTGTETDAKDRTFELVFSVPGGKTTQTVSVHVALKPQDSALAFRFMPADIGNAIIYARNLKAKEPVFFVNNIQDPLNILQNSKKFSFVSDDKTVTLAPSNSPKVTVSKTELTDKGQVKFGKVGDATEDVTGPKEQVQDAVAELAKYDVIGGTTLPQGTEKSCDSTGYCVETDWSAFAAAINTKYKAEAASFERTNQIQRGSAGNLFTYGGILALIAKELLRSFLSMGPALVDTAREMCCNPEAMSCLFDMNHAALPGGAPTFTQGSVPVASNPALGASYMNPYYSQYPGYGQYGSSYYPGYSSGQYPYGGQVAGVYGVSPVGATQCIEVAIRDLCSMNGRAAYRAGRAYKSRVGNLAKSALNPYSSQDTGLIGTGRRLGFCTLLANTALLLMQSGLAMGCTGEMDYERIYRAFTDPSVIPFMKQINAAVGPKASKNNIFSDLDPTILVPGKKADADGGVKTVACSGGSCAEQPPAYNFPVPIISVLFGTNSKGYPYLDCSGSDCVIKMDEGEPVLATLNKYAYALKTGGKDPLGIAAAIDLARGTAPKVTGGKTIEVESCSMEWKCYSGKASDQKAQLTEYTSGAVVPDSSDFVFKCNLTETLESKGSGACSLAPGTSKEWSSNAGAKCKLFVADFNDKIVKVDATIAAIQAIDGDALGNYNDYRIKLITGVKASNTKLKTSIQTAIGGNCVENLEGPTGVKSAAKNLEDAVAALAKSYYDTLEAWRGEKGTALEALKLADRELSAAEQKIAVFTLKINDKTALERAKEALKTEIEAATVVQTTKQTAYHDADIAADDATKKFNNVLMQLQAGGSVGAEREQLWVQFNQLYDLIESTAADRDAKYEDFANAIGTVADLKAKQEATQTALDTLLSGKTPAEFDAAMRVELENAKNERDVKQAALNQKNTEFQAVLAKEPKAKSKIKDLQCQAIGAGYFCGTNSVKDLRERLAYVKNQDTIGDIKIDGNDGNGGVKLSVSSPLVIGSPKLYAATWEGVSVKGDAGTKTVTINKKQPTGATDILNMKSALYTILKYFYNETYVPDATPFTTQLSGFTLALSATEATMTPPAAAAQGGVTEGVALVGGKCPNSEAEKSNLVLNGGNQCDEQGWTLYGAYSTKNYPNPVEITGNKYCSKYTCLKKVLGPVALAFDWAFPGPSDGGKLLTSGDYPNCVSAR
ncbi:MAG: hypothetical protein NTY90_00225 [Candidatus Micrarchaeota archaeon]|nr:hypothetical protein [Candidatus Micrarchaeota archaeon]